MRVGECSLAAHELQLLAEVGLEVAGKGEGGTEGGVTPQGYTRKIVI